MRIVLFRHGISVDHSDPACPPDPQRFLTDRGRSRTRRAAAGLRALGVEPDSVFSSDYVRAIQTAEIAAEELGFDAGRIRQIRSLRPGGDPRQVLREIEPVTGTVLCVGHAPNLDGLLAEALGIREPSPFALKKAGAASVDWMHGRHGAMLDWLLPPRALRALGKR